MTVHSPQTHGFAWTVMYRTSSDDHEQLASQTLVGKDQPVTDNTLGTMQVFSQCIFFLCIHSIPGKGDYLGRKGDNLERVTILTLSTALPAASLCKILVDGYVLNLSPQSFNFLCNYLAKQIFPTEHKIWFR